MGQPLLNNTDEPLDPSFFKCLRHISRESVLEYVRFFLQLTEGTKFILSPHHIVLAVAVEKVISGEITRLIVNEPPGTTKTEILVKGLIGRALGECPRARFIHVSASDDLALRNSSEIRDVMQSDEYKTLYPETIIRGDVHAKKQWKTTEGGGLYALATGGAVIGFRAGRMEKGFSGAIVIDDPHKPEDVLSKVKRDRQNNRFNNTIKTRIATPETPIIVVMQRLHKEDLSGFLLGGGSGDIWDHLVLPAEIPETPEEYPREYTHGRPIEHNLPPGLLWEYKYPKDELEILKADRTTYSAQFNQYPQASGGGVFDVENFKFYSGYKPEEGVVVLDNGEEVALEYKNIYCDTAMKTGEANDYSVFQLWGRGTDARVYLLDQVRGKWEAPVLKNKFLRFSEKHEYGEGNKLGVRSRKIEDKASGIGLIQEIRALKGERYVIGIPRDRDKVSRAKSGTIPIAEGKVVLPSFAYWIDDLVYEFKQFNENDTHKHDDQVDPALDAFSDMLTKSNIANKYLKLIGGFKNE